MIMRTIEEIENDPLYIALENIAKGSRNFHPKREFDVDRFHVYCETVRYEADMLLGMPKETYDLLLSMNPEELKEYMKKSGRTIS